MEMSVSGNFLSFIKGVKDPLKREGGISLKMPQWKMTSSRVEGRISWFFSSCSRKLGFLSRYDGELSDPLTLTQGSPVF